MIGCMKFTIAYKRYLCTLNYFQEKDETKSLNFINYEKVQFESSIHDEQKGIFHCHLQKQYLKLNITHLNKDYDWGNND